MWQSKCARCWTKLRNYGYKNLSSLFKGIDLFELKCGPSNSCLVRNARKNKTHGQN
ncbi:MAG: OST-HTH/LOTUS domain-containing protein [Thermodesulfobacteriota bacterium]